MNLTENISEIIQLSKSRIAKDSAIVLAGNILGAGLGFIATILIVRTFGPAQFGLFSVALAVMMIASQFSDFGIGTGMVRFASLYLKKDSQKANLIFKISLKLKLIIATLVFLIGFFASESLAVHVFGKIELIFPLKLAFIGAFGTSLVGYITATLQARQSFKKFIFVNIVDPFGKFALIGLLFLTYKLNLLSALTTVIILPFIAFLIGSLIIPRGFLRAKGDEKEAFHELFHFSKWILVSVFATMLFMRLDIFMLTSMSNLEEVGYYGAANTLALMFPLITGTVTTILLPKVSIFTTKKEIKNYIKKTLKFTPLVGIIFIPLLIFARFVVIMLFGIEYLSSTAVFQILLTSFIFGIILNPISLVIYTLNKPNILALLNVIQVLLNFIGNLFLIPIYGAVGAAISTFFFKIFGVVWILFWLYKLLYKEGELDYTEG